MLLLEGYRTMFGMGQISEQDLERSENLQSYFILDTKSDPAFDEIARFAALAFETAGAYIVFIDQTRVWFKSCYGLNFDQIPLEHSFSQETLTSSELIELNDLKNNKLYAQHPMFKSLPDTSYFAAAPILSQKGFRIGNLCIVDTKPRQLSTQQKELFHSLARQVMTLVEVSADRQKLLFLSQQSRAIQSISRTGGWELDLKTGKTVWSDEIYHIYGLPLGSDTHLALGLGHYNSEDQKRLEKLIHLASTKGTSFDSEFRFTDAMGIQKWVRSIGKAVRNEQGEIVKIIGTFQDITDRKQTDLALEESNRYLDLALEGASLGIWDWYLETNDVKFDRRWAEMLGIDYETMPMELATWESRVHPDDLASCFHDIQNYLAGKTDQYVNIHRMRHEDGRWVYILDKGKVSGFNQEGKAVRFTGTHLDVTEQKEKEKLITLLSEIRAGYIEFTGKRSEFFDFLLKKLLSFTESEYGFIGEVLHKNDVPYLKTYAISDISWDEASRTLYKELSQTGFTFDNLNSLFGEVLKTRNPIITNSPRNHPKAAGIPKGHPPLLAFLGIPVFHGEKMIAMVGLANRKLGYSESYYEHLIPLISGLGEILYAASIEEQLEQQKQLALHNAKLATIGQLAAGVGHEINNPLAIIAGQLMLTEQHLRSLDQVDDFISDRLWRIQNSITRITNIVNGLRTFARSDESLITSFDLAELIKETLDMLKDLMTKENILISFENLVENAYIKGNRGRIQQVLVNLITNGRDATAGQVDRTITVRLQEKNNHFELFVSDNGPGVPQTIRDKIFDPFFTTKKLNEGTGIGLALVSTIIKEHDGEIRLISNTFGATFKINLPRDSKIELETPGKKEVDDEDEVSLDATILLVEDEPDLREVLVSVLELYCQNIVVAKEGLEALHWLEKNQADLVLTDIMMPGISGFDLLKKTKEFPQHEKTKFIFMTGGVDISPENLEVIHKNASGLLSKPFDLTSLRDHLVQALKD
jgi:PAS domain S-box-containing protein